jgi:hypothetical protein
VSTAVRAPEGFGAALDLVEGVEGWMTDAQARRLWDAGRRVPRGGRIVEIGSFRGRSAIILARAAAGDVELVAIDPHGGGDRGPQEIAPEAERGERDFAAFHANLERAGVAGRVRHVRKLSGAALGEVAAPVDLLYVDGAHRYGPARADIEGYGALVAAGGTMLVHDSYSAIGVTLAAVRLLFASRSWRYVGRSGTLAEYRRERLGPAAVAANLLRQAADLPYFVRNELVKVALLTRTRPLARLLGHQTGDWPY